MTNMFRQIGKNHLRGSLLRLLGLRQNSFHVAKEDISRVHRAFECFYKYHWLRFLADICISSHLAKNIYVVCCCGNYGNGKNLFHEAEEDISWDHPVFERLRRYHWLGFHADICISSHWQKSCLKFLLRVLGLQRKLFHVATEDISWDPHAFERFRKYHWLGFLDDKCVSSDWQKSLTRFIVAAIRVTAKFISCGYRGHIMGPPGIRTF
jgi:hypothetical protein